MYVIILSKTRIYDKCYTIRILMDREKKYHINMIKIRYSGFFCLFSCLNYSEFQFPTCFLYAAENPSAPRMRRLQFLLRNISLRIYIILHFRQTGVPV